MPGLESKPWTYFEFDGEPHRCRYDVHSDMGTPTLIIQRMGWRDHYTTTNLRWSRTLHKSTPTIALIDAAVAAATGLDCEAYEI